MAETIRTWSTLLGTTLANNTTGDISAQDLRDAFWSSQVYGGMCVNDGSSTMAVSSTPAKITLWSADMPSNGVVPDSTTDNDLTIPSGGDGDYLVYCTIDFSISTGTSVFEARLRIGGAEPASPKNLGLHRSISSNALGSASFMGIVTLAAADVLTVWAEFGSGTPNLEIHDGAFFVWRVA